jgi:hypothetical protein
MDRDFFVPGKSGRGLSSRAVSRSRNCGTSPVLGVCLDRLDYQVEFVGAVDLPRNAIVLARCGRLGFSEVIKPINAACRVVSHEQNDTGAIFRPRKQEQVIGAEVEHRGEDQRAGAGAPAPIGSAVEGLPGGLLRPGISPQRGACSKPENYAAGDGGFLALRRLSPPSRKISEFSTNRSTMAVAMVVL